MIHQITPHVDNNQHCWNIWAQPIKIQWKSQKLLSQRIGKRSYKTLGTSSFPTSEIRNVLGILTGPSSSPDKDLGMGTLT